MTGSLGVCPSNRRGRVPGVAGADARRRNPFYYSDRLLATAGKKFVVAAAALAIVTVLLFVLDAVYWDPLHGGKDMRLFQRSVGGLGMGAAATPEWNLFYYDPRLQPVDDSNLWPVPGSYPYSPSAASAVVVFREHPREDLQLTKVER